MQNLHKYSYITALLIIYALDKANSSTLCNANDQACIDNKANVYYQKLMTGIPDVEIEPQDPLFQDLIEGDLSVLKYKFFNTTFDGLKNCKIRKLKFDESAQKLNFDFFCPKIEFYGKYEINGRLIVLPVEGKGDYKIITGEYNVEVECEINTKKGSDGKKYLSCKKFKIKATPLTAIVFDFKNLFNGQKDLSDAVHKFANENWKEVANFVQDPVWNTVIKQEISNANRYLKTVSFDDLN